MNKDPYKRLAERLDALPNGFPPSEDGVELRLLAKLFRPEEAALASELRLTLETPQQIADRIGGDPTSLRHQLKNIARRGLIAAGRTEKGLGYGLLPFAVGIYEMQFSTIDAEFAQLFEVYYRKAFNQALTIQPSIHRVIPVNVSIRNDMEVRPFESVAEIVSSSKAWGVINCLCRTQKALVGEPCNHPLDVCMMLSDTPGIFNHNPNVHAQTLGEALATLQRAAEAGLVHSVSNNRAGIWYICNCCTCSCGVLRGMRDLGIANVIARSAFVNQVDEDLCINCSTCVERCQFNALALDDILRVNSVRCVGCGVCVLACQEGALHLVRRPVGEIVEPPLTETEWRKERATARGLDLSNIL